MYFHRNKGRKTLAMVAVDKVHIFQEVFESLSDNGMRIARFDRSMEWGGFFVIQEASGKRFNELYFENQPTTSAGKHYLLILAPNQIMQWCKKEVSDRHFKVIGGSIVMKLISPGKDEITLLLAAGQSIQISAETHAQIGACDDWAIMAENVLDQI